MFIYLASPYTHSDPDVMEERYQKAALANAHLYAQGVTVYSPIAHCHILAKLKKLPTDFQFWQTHNHRMMLNCQKIVVLKLEGWNDSKGVADEMAFAKRFMKPLMMVTLDQVLNDTYPPAEYSVF